MGPDTTVNTTVCLGPEDLPGLETNEGAPWTTVPEDCPFCSSTSEPVPEDETPTVVGSDPEVATGGRGSSSGCGGADDAPPPTPLVLVVMGFFLAGHLRRQ